MFRFAFALCAAVIISAVSQADVFDMGPGATSLEMVPVGNPGNAADFHLGQSGQVPNDGTTGYGSVAYNYQISKYKTTAGQYAAFLNAVASTSDPYGLYNSNMAYSQIGSTITKNGSVFAASMPNQPMNYMSWGDAARFANWLSNGQPNTGVEDSSTTEDGSYFLNGKMSQADLMTVTRKPNATFVIPTENEWYKAAYYDPNKGGPGVAGYWVYPTKHDTEPSNILSSTGTNNANFYDWFHTGNGGYTVGSPPWTTDVGSFANSKSAYGTLDQGGDVWEWNESAYDDSTRGMRGSSYAGNGYDTWLSSFYRYHYNPAYEINGSFGFRVAEVPEPSTIVLLGIGGFGMLAIRRKLTAILAA